MLKLRDESAEQLTPEKISALFECGCKHVHSHKVGIEYERIPISAKDYRAIDYSEENGIYDLLRAYAKIDGWDYITDDYNIIGLRKGSDTITLEPGCQLELSLKPEATISALKNKIDNFNKKINPLLKKYDINLLEYGVSPVSTYKNINLIPKKRYHIMAKYLWGILSDVMMRETAGVQACFDFASEEDAMRKFRIANKLSPFMTAMFANSPIRGGVDTGYKSFRGLSWLNTDNERCGFISKNLFNGNTDYNFKDYISDIMQAPMIFIVRGGKPVEICGKLNFEQFTKSGFEGYTATIDDFKLHANLCFPEVRLRNFIEIRNHDCVNHGLQYAILAIYKGILYNKDAMVEMEQVLSKLTYNEFMEFRYNVPKHGLQTKVKRVGAKDIAKEILNISQYSLKEFSQGEEQFLEPIMDLTPYGLSPADIIMANWNTSWNKDVKKLIKFLTT